MYKTLLASCFAAALMFTACGGGDSVSSVSNGKTGQKIKPSVGEKKGSDSSQDSTGSNTADASPKGDSANLKSSGKGLLTNKKVAFEQLKEASGDIPPQPVLN